MLQKSINNKQNIVMVNIYVWTDSGKRQSVNTQRQQMHTSVQNVAMCEQVSAHAN